VLVGLLHLHSPIPYIQMGRSIALCTVSLLSMDSCERAFISHLMFLSLSSSWHRLAFMYVFHVTNRTFKTKFCIARTSSLACYMPHLRHTY